MAQSDRKIPMVFAKIKKEKTDATVPIETEVKIKREPGSDYSFKVLLIGDDKVGKTSLVNRHIEGSFREYPEEKRFQIQKKVSFQEKSVQYSIYEKPSQYTGDSQVILALFDLTDQRSLLGNEEGYEDLKSHVLHRTISHSIVLLVGTKADEIGKRQITEEQVRTFINTFEKPTLDFEGARKISGYYEVSAKTGENIDLVFLEACRLAIEKQKKEELSKSLRDYIRRIESHKDENGNVDFAHDFLVFKTYRAFNRQANYLLAKSLLSKLTDGDPLNNISKIFADISAQRASLITSNHLVPPLFWIVRWINSRELKAILRQANQFIAAQLEKHKSSSSDTVYLLKRLASGKIQLSTEKGEVLEGALEDKSKVKQIKTMIQQKTSVSESTIKLSYAGKILKNETQLAEILKEEKQVTISL